MGGCQTGSTGKDTIASEAQLSTLLTYITNRISANSSNIPQAKNEIHAYLVTNNLRVEDVAAAQGITMMSAVTWFNTTYWLASYAKKELQ